MKQILLITSVILSNFLSAQNFTLPKLPYAYTALEPTIDSVTMRIHHSKHHQAYVTNLNKALGTSNTKSVVFISFQCFNNMFGLKCSE